MFNRRCALKIQILTAVTKVTQARPTTSLKKNSIVAVLLLVL